MTTKQELFKPNKSFSNHTVEAINKETDDEKLCELVQKFHTGLSETMERIQKPTHKEIGHKEMQYFWVQPNNVSITNDDEDLKIIKHYVFRFDYSEGKEILKIDPDYRHVIDNCINKLERKKQYRVIRALNYILNMDASLSIYQRNQMRKTIRENPYLIIDLLSTRLQALVHIPGNNVLKEILALLNLALEIIQMPDGRNWTWLFQIIMVDVLSLCHSFQKTNKTEYTKLLVWLNLMFFGYFLSWHGQELEMMLKIAHVTENLSIKHKNWTIPSQYVEPLTPSQESKPLKIIEVFGIFCYKLVMKINRWVVSQKSDIIFEDTLLSTYREAITKLKEDKPEVTVSILYQLISLCHKYEWNSFLCIIYTNLAYCFFLLRQTWISIFYLELVCHSAKKQSSIILEILAHKQLAMIAGCQLEYKTSIFHFSKALEISTFSKYFEEELFDEIFEIRTSLAQEISKYKTTEGRFSLEDPLKIKFKCTCNMYK